MPNLWSWIESRLLWLVSHEQVRDTVVFALTVAAALGAVIWFIRQGRHLARINLSQSVEVYPATDHWLLKVVLTLQNVGEVSCRVSKLGVVAQQVLPLPPGISKSLGPQRGLVDELAIDDVGRPPVDVLRSLGAVDQRSLRVPLWLFRRFPRSWMVRRMRVGRWFDLASRGGVRPVLEGVSTIPGDRSALGYPGGTKV